jgi:hypothetical protein
MSSAVLEHQYSTSASRASWMPTSTHQFQHVSPSCVVNARSAVGLLLLQQLNTIPHLLHNVGKGHPAGSTAQWC